MSRFGVDDFFNQNADDLALVWRAGCNGQFLISFTFTKFKSLVIMN